MDDDGKGRFLPRKHEILNKVKKEEVKGYVMRT